MTIFARFDWLAYLGTTGGKMADEISAINEAVVQTNTKKATNFGLSVFTGR